MSTYVYFIVNDARQLVKIGTSDDPQVRLVSLRSSSAAELRIAALVPGDERYESALHDRFADLRVAGEWFALEGELATLVALLPSVDVDAKPRANRARVKPSLTAEQKERVIERHAAWLNAIRDAVFDIGLADFAGVIDADRGDVMRALNGQGRYFRYDWWLALIELRPNDERLWALAEALATPAPAGAQ